MPFSSLSIQQLWISYKQWVTRNPHVIGDVETTVKWASYLVAGRITDSNVATELIYSLSNLLCLLNDRILLEKVTRTADEDGVHQIKMFLTTLEYCEVFIELSGQRLWGTKGRWAFIVLLQLIKCVGRLVLVLKKSEKIVRSPPIPALDRPSIAAGSSTSKESIDAPPTTAANPAEEGFQAESNVVKLRKSGKLLRRINGAPPLHLRNWKPLEDMLEHGQQKPRILLDTAELIYILKPIVHLGSIGTFGYADWRSWSVALLMDMASLRVYYTNRQHLTKDQKLELSKRCLMMFMYLMRSPFYDKISGKRIDGVLATIARRIPFARYICQPLAQYIPVWQSNYFYMWST